MEIGYSLVVIVPNETNISPITDTVRSKFSKITDPMHGLSQKYQALCWIDQRGDMEEMLKKQSELTEALGDECIVVSIKTDRMSTTIKRFAGFVNKTVFGAFIGALMGVIATPFIEDAVRSLYAPIFP